MKNSATIESLKAMRCSAMAAELERQIQYPAAYAHMGFEERVALRVDAEWNSRQNLLHIKILCHFVNGVLLSGIDLDGKSLLHGFLRIVVLPLFRLIEQAQLVFSHDIGSLSDIVLINNLLDHSDQNIRLFRLEIMRICINIPNSIHLFRITAPDILCILIIFRKEISLAEDQ